jgi:choice-of-anchor A domain-containing protein
VGEVGVFFDSGPIMVNGGTPPYTFSIVGALPPGLNLNPSNGEITGIPSAPGSFKVKVTDSNGASTTSCAITINPALMVTCGTNSIGEVGVSFDSGPMNVTGGTAPYTFSIVGTLPPGLSLNPSNGEITGIATAPGTFAVKVTDALGASSTNCNITINPALMVTCGKNNVGEVGVAFDSGPMNVTGGTPPYTYSIVGTLPPGLTLNPSNGEITGTATAPGSFAVKVTDSNGASSTNCNITINPKLSVTCGVNSIGEVGVAFDSGPMTVTGGVAPYTFSIVGTLPPGLTLNPNNGEITGTATAPGSFAVKVTDANGASSTNCNITINPKLSVTCGVNNVGTVGVPFDSGPMNVTGGTPPYTYSIVGTFPPGLSLNPSNGEITGTPTAPGTFAVKVTDSLGASSTNCNITINPAPLGTISGYTYTDVNTNMMYDNPPDTPIGSVTVTLTDCSNNVIATQMTNASGFYQFTGLPAGCYKVSSPPTANGETLETPSPLTVNLPPGGNSMNNNFGYITPGCTNLPNFAAFGSSGVTINDSLDENTKCLTGNAGTAASGSGSLYIDKCQVNGNVYVPTAGALTLGSHGAFTGSEVIGSQSGTVASMIALSATEAGLTPNVTIASLTSSTTFTNPSNSGGTYVINVTGAVNLNSNTITFIANNPSAKFVINIAGTTNTISQSFINLTGISASQILWNFTGPSGCSVEVNKSASQWNGTILAPNCSIRVHNPFPFIGDLLGNTVQIDSAAVLTGTAPFCAPNKPPAALVTLGLPAWKVR